MANLVVRMLLIACLVSTIIACEKEEEINLTTLSEDSTNYEPLEIELMILVNNYRNSLGLSLLSSLKLVSIEAETHTVYMIQKGVASHDNFPIRTFNLIEKEQALSVGENISYGIQSPNEIMQGWLLSASHRANIERKAFTNFGISARKDRLGRYFITQIYIGK